MSDSLPTAGGSAAPEAADSAYLRGLIHDLRSPLAVLNYRQALALLEDDVARKNQQLADMQPTLDRLSLLCEQLMESAHFRPGEPHFGSRGFAAAPWLADLKAEVEAYAAARGVAFTANVVCRANQCAGSVTALTRAVMNVLTNAVNHGASRGDIMFTRRGHAQVLSVSDDGPGFSRADVRNAGRPGYRGTQGKRNGDSHGLGLAIVREVLRLHGGGVSLGRSALGGARVILRWPGR